MIHKKQCAVRMGPNPKFNDYRIDGDIVYLTLTHKEKVFEALIDLADLQILLDTGKRWGVNIVNDGRQVYVYRWTRNESGKNSSISLHRFLTGASCGLVVDHINRNTLDNRRSNSRVVTNQVNLRNRGARSDSSTGVRGVTRSSRSPRRPYLIQLFTKGHRHQMRVTTLNIGRITASLLRAQKWGSEAA